MAKGGDLWDDSALIDAFDHAMSTYKKMHKKKIQDLGPDNGEVVSVLDNNSTKLKNENAVTLSTQTVNGLTAVEECNELPLITEDHVPETSVEGVTQDANFDHHSAGLDYYNQLLGQYYELEASRQKVLEQLSQCGDVNYQNYGASQVDPGSMAGASRFPQDHVSACQVTCPAEICCCCPYVCPTSSVPYTLSSCSVGKTAGIQHHENAAVNNCGITRMGMEAVGKAMSSLKVKAPTSEVTDKETRVEGDNASSSTETDITDVLNAWYTAGFYTGKYLAEQSVREKPCG